MCKYSSLQFACLRTPYNKPFNWEFVTLFFTVLISELFQYG
nr:MAG TPA: hypothetical protein [Caudoviricetes sp.]